jgi:uncharacterized protein (TIGR02246 family)
MAAYTLRMKRGLTTISGLFLLCCGLSGAQVGTSDDVSAIVRIVNHWQQTWDSFDGSVLAGDYDADADWLNAFGTRLKGAPAIEAFMRQVVQRPNVKTRRTTWQDPTIRFVRSDVAIASRDYATVGHRTPDGREMPERKTHSTWVLAKDGGGKWRIVSQVISDNNGGA